MSSNAEAGHTKGLSKADEMIRNIKHSKRGQDDDRKG